MTTKRVEITDDLDLLLAVLPPHLRSSIERLGETRSLVEIVLDFGRRPEVRFLDRAVDIEDELINREDIHYVVSRIGEFTKDNRAGIERTLHRISGLRNRLGDVIGLTCRVGRAVFGTVAIVRDVIESGKSVLLLGHPGVGKTTLLREAARVMADELGKRVIVVDTSNEIAGDGDIAHPGIGRARRMQVPSPDRQHAVMIEAVENHMPEVIVIDEIGTTAEAMAARTIAERGVQLIATAHGHSLENLIMNPTLADLIGGIQPVTLSDEEARRRRTQKTVLERKSPPTFDVLIEIQTKDRFSIHHNVALVVDQLLRSVPASPEVRVRKENYEVEVVTPPPEPIPPTDGDSRPEIVVKPATKKTLRIFPYGVTKQRLERAIHDLRVPAYTTTDLMEADLVLTLKSHAKGQARKIQEAAKLNIPVHVIKSNTYKKVQGFLQVIFDESEYMDEQEAALREVEDAIPEVVEGNYPVELAPHNSYLRRLQHELAGQYGLLSESKGREPFRRVVIYPAQGG